MIVTADQQPMDAKNTVLYLGSVSLSKIKISVSRSIKVIWTIMKLIIAKYNKYLMLSNYHQAI